MIESLQNERIKKLSRIITDNRFRKKAGIFVVEGKQENERALRFGYEAEEFYITQSIYNAEPPSGKVCEVSPKVYEKLAYRGKAEGIIGLYREKECSLEDFNPSPQSSVIVVESLEKPGNLGAILRSCEAFGIEALLIADPRLDIYNPNVIRSSVGCLFGMNVYQAEKEEIHAFLKDRDFKIFTTIMDSSARDIHTQDLSGRAALVFGTEHSGLSTFWQDKGKNTLIPMAGSIDSLNLSNAVAISCYEILRQKLQKKT